ncbi:MAG: biotin--[acetyl-CoA-carboxylase] ligase [Thermoplasmata archaeon]
MSEVIVKFFDSVSSTMDIASDLALKGAPEGTVVVARKQKQGRGRLRSEWFSPEGGAWFSIVLKPRTDLDESHRIVLLAGLCVCTLLRESHGMGATLRWPNDILLEGKKLAGILGEGLQTKDAYYAVIGVGVNTNFHVDSLPESLREEATTTLDFLGYELDNKSLVKSVAQDIMSKSTKLTRDFPLVLEQWVGHSDTIGQEILLDGNRAGKAIRLDPEGFLVTVDSDGNERRIVSGRIRYLDTT